MSTQTRSREKKASSEGKQIPPALVNRWKLEGTVYASVATLDQLIRSNERGEVDPEVFHRQMRSHLKSALQARAELEGLGGFSLEKFIAANQLDSDFSHGLSRLKMAEGIETQADKDMDVELVRLNYREITKLPTRAADFVASAIEVVDLLRLGSVATVARLIPLLDDLKSVLQASSSVLGSDYWVLAEVEDWLRFLARQRPNALLDDQSAQRLELQCVRWLNSFRSELKNL